MTAVPADVIFQYDAIVDFYHSPFFIESVKKQLYRVLHEMTVDLNLYPLEHKKGEPGNVNNLPDIVLGAGVFNYQYADAPYDLDAVAVLRRAFELGIRALDTSAYYGPSEIIIGEALEKLRDEYPRESYMICTKAGREKVDEFIYSSEHIRFSVKRSLERLKTDYLDILYVHDVEFVSTEECLEALNEAMHMKKEGLVRNVGISGYPLDFLLYLSKKVLGLGYGPLDVVLSYSNFCLQNTLLRDYHERFLKEAEVSRVLNASPLSMSLLRSQPTHAFHPAPEDLRVAVARVSSYCSSKGVELADLASRFALRNWDGPTVFGLSNVQEVEQAVKAYWQSRDAVVTAEDDHLVQAVNDILGETFNLTWPSGIEHPDMQ